MSRGLGVRRVTSIHGGPEPSGRFVRGSTPDSTGFGQCDGRWFRGVPRPSFGDPAALDAGSDPREASAMVPRSFATRVAPPRLERPHRARVRRNHGYPGGSFMRGNIVMFGILGAMLLAPQSGGCYTCQRSAIASRPSQLTAISRQRVRVDSRRVRRFAVAASIRIAVCRADF